MPPLHRINAACVAVMAAMVSRITSSYALATDIQDPLLPSDFTQTSTCPHLRVDFFFISCISYKLYSKILSAFSSYSLLWPGYLKESLHSIHNVLRICPTSTLATHSPMGMYLHGSKEEKSFSLLQPDFCSQFPSLNLDIPHTFPWCRLLSLV